MVKIYGHVNNPLGLTSRICAELVAEANRATACKITLYSDGDSADLKSIMNMMSLIIKYDQDFIIDIEGPAELDVKDKFTKLLDELKLLK